MSLHFKILKVQLFPVAITSIMSKEIIPAVNYFIMGYLHKRASGKHTTHAKYPVFI